MSEREMQDLLDLVARTLGRSWLDIVEWLRDQNALEAVDARLAAGDIQGVIREVQTAAERYAADTHAAYITGGQKAASWLDAQTASSIIRFDVQNSRAVTYAQQQQRQLIAGLTQESRQVVQRVIVDGIRNGDNPLETARNLRDSIGLAPSQADAVASYRRALESGDYRNAISRALSDGRTDRSLEAALRNGTAIDPSRIDAMVERYRQNMIGYRAQVIARTESLRAVHAGTHELYRQAVDNGDVDADQLTRSWVHTGHGKDSRPGHIQMNGQTRGPFDPFDSPDGAQLMYPGDPDAPPDETVQCRCTVATRFAA